MADAYVAAWVGIAMVPKNNPCRTVAAVLALALGLGLSACSSAVPNEPPSTSLEPTDTPTPSETPTQTPTPSATPTVAQPSTKTNPQARSSLADSGALRISVDSFPQSWNPWTSQSQALDLVTDIMSPRLFSLDSLGEWIWDPTWLGSEPKAHGNIVTYTLRPEAVWNDGIPLSAHDFWWTWQVCKTSKLAQCTGRGFESVIAVNQGISVNEVVITYVQTYVDWPATYARGPWRGMSGSDLARPSTGEAPSSTADLFSDQSFVSPPIENWESLAGKEAHFSGPFRFWSWDGATLKLVRNNSWWGEPALLNSIELRLLSSSEFALEYGRGKIDALWVSDANDYARVSGLSGISLRSDTSTTSRWLVANLTSGPLSSPLLYRAMYAGLDRARIAQSDLSGLPEAGTLDNPIFHPLQTGFVNFAADSAAWSVADAEEALDQAGYIVGDDGIRTLDGSPLTLRFAIPQGDTLAENEAFAVRAQLFETLGIVVTLDYVEAVDILAGAYDLTPVTLNERSPLSSALRFASGNPWGYDNGNVTSILRAASHKLDTAAMREGLAEVARTVWKYGPLIPLYDTPEVFLTRPALANLGPDGLGTTKWENVGWVK